MRAELRVAAACFVVLVTLVASACGGERTMRVGVLADCRGAFGAVNELALAGAEFPLLEHGARLRGVKPSDGVTAARVAGRRVELLIGCSESGVYDILVSETRRLIEVEHADAIVGGFGSQDSLVLREVARKYPEIPFVLAGNSQREATVRDAVANVYRFEADDAQQVAGLGTFAYRDLGWRRAAVVADDYSWGWAQAEAFTAEFCALGGRIVSRLDVFPYDPKTADPRRVPVAGVDGIAAFVTPFAGSSEFLRALARRVGSPERRLLLGPWITIDPMFRRDVGRAAVGAVAGTAWLPDGGSQALAARERAFRAVFPQGAGLSFGDLVPRGYATAVGALIDALQTAHGTPSRLNSALARTVLRSPDAARLDSNRQAIVNGHLARLVALPGGTAVGMQVIRTIPDVDESFGGLLPATPTSAASSVCRRAEPPPWAAR